MLTFIAVLIFVYVGSCVLVVKDGLASLGEIRQNDFFDQNDKRTKQYFVELKTGDAFRKYDGFVRENIKDGVFQGKSEDFTNFEVARDGESFDDAMQRFRVESGGPKRELRELQD